MIGWLLGGMVLEATTGLVSDLFDGSFKTKAIRYYKDLKDMGYTDEEALRKTKDAMTGWEIERDMGSW